MDNIIPHLYDFMLYLDNLPEGIEYTKIEMNGICLRVNITNRSNTENESIQVTYEVKNYIRFVWIQRDKVYTCLMTNKKVTNV